MWNESNALTIWPSVGLQKEPLLTPCDGQREDFREIFSEDVWAVIAVPGILPNSLQICTPYFIAQAWSFESMPCTPTLLHSHILAPQIQRIRNAMYVRPSHCSPNGRNTSKWDEPLATSRWPGRTVLKGHSSIISCNVFPPIRRSLFILHRVNLDAACSASFAQLRCLVPQSWTTTADSCAVSSKAKGAAILQIPCEQLQPPFVHYARR